MLLKQLNSLTSPLSEQQVAKLQQLTAEMSALEDLILTVTEKGAGKLSSSHDYPVRGRGGQGVETGLHVGVVGGGSDPGQDHAVQGRRQRGVGGTGHAPVPQLLDA